MPSRGLVLREFRDGQHDYHDGIDHIVRPHTPDLYRTRGTCHQSAHPSKRDYLPLEQEVVKRRSDEKMFIKQL